MLFRLIFSSDFRNLVNLWDQGLRQLGWPESATNLTPRDHGGEIPWLTYGAIDYLDQVVPLDATILEIGGGNSTKWWNRRGNMVVTVESDKEWLKNITSHAAEAHFCKTSREVVELMELEADKGVQFHTVIVDGVEPRSDYIAAASRLVAPGGLLVIDNADREEYQAAISSLVALNRLDFFGLGPSNRYAWCTSIFFAAPPPVAGRSRLGHYQIGNY